MKEVICTACNFSVVPEGEDKAKPMVEVIVVVSEPEYRFNGGGQLTRDRVTSTIRFSSSPEGLRNMAKSLEQWAEEAEVFAEKITSPQGAE